MKIGKMRIEWTEWMMTLIENSATRFHLTNSNPKAALAQYGYFMTVTFSKKGVLGWRGRHMLSMSDASVQWDAVHSLYHDATRKAFGSRYYKTRFAGRWPLLIVALDFGGSRLSRVLTESEAVRANDNTHFHGVWLVHPSSKDAFESYFTAPDLIDKAKSWGPIDAIEIIPFDASKALDYALKGQMKSVNVPSTSSDEIRVYPNPDTSANTLFYRWSFMPRRIGARTKRILMAIRFDRREASEITWL